MRIAVVVAVLAVPVSAAPQVTAVIDAEGAGPLAELAQPGQIDRAPDGSLWVPGALSANLFRVDADGSIEEVFSLWPQLQQAAGLAVVPDGTVYVTAYQSDGVLRVSNDGTVTPAADADGAGPGQGLDGPRAIAADAAGNVYVAARLGNNVLRIAPDGSVAQLVGAAGAGAGMPLNDPRDVAVSAAGVVYVAGTTSDNVLAVDPGGALSQAIGPAGDGAGNPLNGASALAVAPDGTLYVASLFSHTVLRRSPAGVVDVVVTSAGDGAGHPLFLPVDLALGADGTLYVASLGTDSVLARAPGGAVTFLAGFSGDGAGHLLNDPTDLLLAPDGALLVACAASENLFRLSGGSVTWLANVPGFGSGPSSNGEGALALDGSGQLLVSGWNNDQVVRFESGGGTTVLVDGAGGPGSDLDPPSIVRLDTAGRAFVASSLGTVFRFDDASGAFTVVIPPEGDGNGNALDDVHGMTFDAQERLVVAGRDSDNLLRVEADGSITKLLGAEDGLNGPHDLQLGPDGSLYIANLSAKNILALRPDGSVEEVVSNADVHPGSTNNPGWYHVAVDNLDRVYLAGYFTQDLWRHDPDGTLTLLWETTGIERPVQVEVDAGGGLYLGLDANDDSVLRIEPSGATSVVIGPEGDGAGHPLDNPQDMLIAGTGRLDVSSFGGDSVLSVDLGFCGGWTLLPGALPADGSGPLLTGEGPLCAASSWLLQLSDGAPGATATLVVGFSALSAPFKGGTLIPFPNLLLPLPLDGTGAAQLSGPWPAGVTSGAAVWMQAWIPGPAASFSASNGLRIDQL
jgi:sugar lactone lactonase YvrE